MTYETAEIVLMLSISLFVVVGAAGLAAIVRDTWRKK